MATIPFSAAIDAIDPVLFKASMRRLAGAVSVITVGSGADRTGFTATSVSSLSADPPAVMVSLNRASSSWPVLERHGSFCINVLAHDQHQIAQSFAGFNGERGAERYGQHLWRTLATGASALADALTVVDCELDDVIHKYSHAILIGRVRAVTLRDDTHPLVYWQGEYRALAGAMTTR
jgi:flavin reductase (DIM6/NTAB) family NADH-FMN oxidoreductase RutF